MSVPAFESPASLRRRPLVAFFDYPDVFEDFYPHFGVSQRELATSWSATGSHALVGLIQRHWGDVVWCSFALAPQLDEDRHSTVGCRVRFLRSSIAHRALWRLFYSTRWSWRLRRHYRAFATAASYLSPATTRLVAFLRRERPDLLLVQDYSSGKFDVLTALAACFEIPLVAVHAGSESHSYLGRHVRKSSLPRATRLIVSSRNEIDKLVAAYALTREQLGLILTPIDTEALRPVPREAACIAAGLDPSRRYLLYMGRLDDGVKRVSLLMRSFAAASRDRPGVELLVAGDGPDRGRLTELAAEAAPGRCRFLGWVSGDAAKRALYNSADCLALTSKREGFPSAVGESMACGTPVLATDVGGISELVEHDVTGWLCSPGDEPTLTALLSRRLAESGPAPEMREACRRAALRRVSHQAVAGQLGVCLDEALMSRRRARAR